MAGKRVSEWEVWISWESRTHRERGLEEGTGRECAQGRKLLQPSVPMLLSPWQKKELENLRYFSQRKTQSSKDEKDSTKKIPNNLSRCNDHTKTMIRKRDEYMYNRAEFVPLRQQRCTRVARLGADFVIGKGHGLSALYLRRLVHVLVD